MDIRSRASKGFRAFVRDEGGQGVLFAAASMMVLVAYVALVTNVGATATRRIRTQIGTDAAAYSGAVIQANSISAIAWINSGMAQVYRQIMRYSVDLSAAGVAAEMERRQGSTGLAHVAFQEARQRAQAGIPHAKQILEDLSVIQNAIAIITPELMWQEMYRVGQEHGLERIAVFPFQRMFPHEGQEANFLIEKLENPPGWRITNLNAQGGEMIVLRLAAPRKWEIEHTRGDMVHRRWVITQDSDSPPRWLIQMFEGDELRRQIYIIQVDDVWLISPDGVGVPGTPGAPPPGGSPVSIRNVRVGGRNAVEITYEGVTQIICRQDGRLYRWNPASRRWEDMTQDRVRVGDYDLAVHSDNRIRLPGMTVHLGQPASISLGSAHITLSSPDPRIRVSVGGLRISVVGFNPDAYSISYRGHSLTNRQADGRWRMHFNHQRKLWWRHRLTELESQAFDAETTWQYDYQLLGAVLRYEDNLERFVIEHAIGDDPAGVPHYGDWLEWWDPVRGGVRPVSESQPGLVMVQTCRRCGGTGEVGRGDDRETCPACRGLDHNGDGRTDIRVTLHQLLNPPQGWQGYVVDRELANPVPFSRQGRTRWPLVLTEDFFRWGITVGGWRPPHDAPMLFDKEPDWGYVAISAARIGVPYLAGIGGLYPQFGAQNPGYLYQFDDPYDREHWVENSPENLYRADLQARLFSTRRQVKLYDIEENRLVGTRISGEPETPSSFLWNTLIHGRPTGLDEASLWLDEFGGRSDHEMSRRLQRMENRAGRRFDLRSNRVDDLIRH